MHFLGHLTKNSLRAGIWNYKHPQCEAGVVTTSIGLHGCSTYGGTSHQKKKKKNNNNNLTSVFIHFVVISMKVLNGLWMK
jgi:hypothetical protein